MFWPHDQEAETFPFPLVALPVLVRLHISQLPHRHAGVAQLLAVDQIDIGAISSILEFLRLFLDVLNDIVIELHRAADFEFVYPGSEKAVDLFLSFLQIVFGGGL